MGSRIASIYFYYAQTESRWKLRFLRHRLSIMTITLYGIPNCDTVKKARTWLTAKGIGYAFHDYKKQAVEEQRVLGWIETAGLDRVRNKGSSLYQKLPDALKAHLDDAKSAASLLASNPSMIKRPIVEYDGGLLVGFKPAEWEAALTS
jgi:Spx/MgsR family transcriptional regulator